MTKLEMAEWLAVRYEEQCLEFPLIREITEKVYVRVNLKYMITSDYWKERKVSG